MKNFIKIISIFLLLFCTTVIKAQTPNTCTAAATYSYPINQTVTSYTYDTYWFKTTIGPGNFQINVKSSSLSKKIIQADVYTGTCGSPIYYSTDSLLDNSVDSIFNIPITNTVSTVYYVKLKNGGSNTTFSVTTSPLVLIGGDIGYCPGSTITLTTIVNSGATGTVTPTYTWSANLGGVHTVSVAVTPTTTATYTLGYTDKDGTTYTTSVTTFTLPPSMCGNCEMIQNGSFESFFQITNTTGNLAPPSTCTVVSYGSDPEYWGAATCYGSADYFCTAETYTSGVQVPSSFFSYTLNLTPHTGNAYCGFYSMVNGANYREYLQEQLKCPLINGLTYKVSFYTSLADRSDYATNNIGAYIGSAITNTATTGPPLSSYTPQINSASVINNPGSWQQVTGTYIATGGEQYITIGNFYDDAHTTLATNSGGPPTFKYGYYFLDDVSITPASPTVTASNCQSGTVTISAYGAPNSTVTTWAGPSSYTATGNVITVASPTAAVTYTCTIHTHTICPSCSDLTQTITINPVTPCSGTAPTYTPGANYTFTTSPGYATSDIYVNGINYTIASTDLRMAAGKSIVVSPTGTLTIAGSWIHACNQCNNGSMWQGITVQNGGTLIITTGGGFLSTTCNIIEDAVKAVYTALSTTTTPIPHWNIDNVIFNNNTTDIYIDYHPGNLSGNSISSSVFTCRNLGNHSVGLFDFLNTKSDIAAATPLLPSTQNPTDLTIAGARTGVGIYINQVAYTNPINVVSTVSSYNLFDNLNVGIYAYQASLTAKGNRFQNLTGNSNSNIIGIGIESVATSTLVSGGVGAKLIVGNATTTKNNAEVNYFTNCLYGIFTKDMRQVYINNNTFDNETTATTFTTAGTYVTGQFGVYQSKYARSAGSGGAGDIEQCQYANNTCNNYATAHFLDFQTLTNTNAGGTTSSAYLYNNTISGVGSSSRYCNSGIYLQQSGNFGTSGAVPQDAILTYSNTITNITGNCITASAITTNTAATNGFVTISSNTELSLKYSTAGTSTTSPPIAAVYISGSKYVKVSNNPAITCTGFGTTPYPNTYAQYFQGVYVNASPNSRITCNTVGEFGEDFVWYGNNLGSKWYENNIRLCRYGLVLRSTGILGDQGTLTQPIYNIWGNSDITSYQTLVDASNPSAAPTSTLNCIAPTCTAATTSSPCTNTITTGTAYASGTTLRNATGNSYSLCTSEGGNGFMAINNDHAKSEVVDSSLLALLNFTDSLPVYTHETYWATQYYVSSVNSSIAAVSGYENAKTFASIDGAIANRDYSTAQNLLGTVVTGNIIESNWKAVDNILVAMAMNNTDSLTANDVGNLQSIAAQCPQSGGSIVWRARALINNYYSSIINYPGDCPSLTGNVAQRAANISSTNAVVNPTVNLYPNPNNGKLYISNFSANQKSVYIEISDITGNLLVKQQSVINNGLVELNLDFDNGIYLVKIINGNDSSQTHKMILNK
jgi:hypothetical protein